MKETKTKRLLVYKTITILALIMNCFGCSINTAANYDYYICWNLNEDGTYTFTSKAGNSNSEYSWYVIENNTSIVKTPYTKSPSFVYDIANNGELVIKCFVKNKDNKETYTIKSSEIIGNKNYVIDSYAVPDDCIELFVEELQNWSKINWSQKMIETNGQIENYSMSIPLDWTCSNISDRSTKFKINGLMFLDALFEDYLITGNEESAKRIVSYVVDWAKQNPSYNKYDEWQWHEDATANRVFRMCIYYKMFEKYFSNKEFIMVKNSLDNQANLLTQDFYYKEKHNHGMHQDEALLAYSLLIGNENDRKNQIPLLLQRLTKYITYVYTDDGVHKEHSPMYSRDVLNGMIFLSKITKKMSNQFYDFISRYIDNAREQLIQIIKPNGMLPGIGDSESYSGRDVLKYACSNVEKYKSIFCYENVDEYLMKNDTVFDKGGYAIFRSSWNDKADEATWMLFNAATFSSTHKHGDDLEVLLYHKGDLFVEGGKRDYNYLDEKTAWSYSSYAHNVLVVNDKPFPVKIGSNGFQSIYPEALDTKIVDYDIEDEVKSVCGYQKRYEGIEQYRTLEYDKENNIIRIIDDIKANMIYNGSLLWHIDPEVVVILEENDIKFFRNDENIAIAHIESDSAYDIEMIQSEGEYPYYTYTFVNGEQRNGGLLKINFVGDEITKIVL